MIFITVGSQKFQFNRLLKAVDELVANGEIAEEVFAQSGVCDYVPAHYEYKPFLNRDEFESMMDKASIVITHGGTGAIISAIKDGNKVVAVPSLMKYGEHVGDHQLLLISEFTKSNFISSCENLSELGKCLKELEKKEFAIYQSNTEKYLDSIIKYIDKEVN